jgi:restriction system protein
MILDYTDFVEMACEEEDGVYSHYPSSADVLRAAPCYIDSSEAPVDPFAVTQADVFLAHDRWMDFTCLRWNTFGEWYHLDKCPHCHSRIDYSSQKSHLSGDVLRSIELRRCLNCGWWDTEENGRVIQEDNDKHYCAPSVHRRAILRQFDVAGSDIPIQSLRAYLACRPDALSCISPYALEKLVADVFRETMNCEAIHVGGPNDKGIDVVLIEGERRYVVQTKRRTKTSAEGVSGIREFVGAMVLAGEMRGIFVTTAPHFSDNAVSTAELAAERRLVEYIELVSARRLIDICKLAADSDDEQWEKVRSQGANLYKHMNPGFSTFMEMFMGHPDWKVARESDLKERQKPGIHYRYFTNANDR